MKCFENYWKTIAGTTSACAWPHVCVTDSWKCNIRLIYCAWCTVISTHSLRGLSTLQCQPVLACKVIFRPIVLPTDLMRSHANVIYSFDILSWLNVCCKYFIIKCFSGFQPANDSLLHILSKTQICSKTRSSRVELISESWSKLSQKRCRLIDWQKIAWTCRLDQR